MKGEIISIGSELASGQNLDTNSQWLSRRLAELGIPVGWHTTVADDLGDNIEAFRIAAARADLILITGGLGPTQDDLTREALAKAAGVDLLLNQESLDRIERMFQSHGRSMPERNRVQALFPAGAEPIINDRGTAPGIWMTIGKCVIVAMPDRRGTIPMQEILQLRLRGVKVEEATSWLEKISGRIEVEQLYPSWLIYAEGFRFSPAFMMLRRVFSWSASFLLLLLVLPVIPLVILAIKLDSRGDLLYKQKRVGRGGLMFHCYKFRTMRPNAEADTGPTWAGDDDPRITRIGKFLRKSRLDEVPQLWNVLRGDMAFVGPRPERAIFCRMLENETPFYALRYSVRPGITGWAQVKYQYGASIEEAKTKLEYDLFYIKHLSLTLDLAILFETAKVVLWQRGAK